MFSFRDSRANLYVCMFWNKGASIISEKSKKLKRDKSKKRKTGKTKRRKTKNLKKKTKRQKNVPWSQRFSRWNRTVRQNLLVNKTEQRKVDARAIPSTRLFVFLCKLLHEIQVSIVHTFTHTWNGDHNPVYRSNSAITKLKPVQDLLVSFSI